MYKLTRAWRESWTTAILSDFNVARTSLHTQELRTYTSQELRSYTTFRTTGVSAATVPWINKASQTLCNTTEGEISKASLETLRDYVLTKYTDICAKWKVLNFAKAFLRYLTKTHFDTRYKEFALFLEMSRAVKESKRVTKRIVVIEDIKTVLAAIEEGHKTVSLRRDIA